VYRKQGPAANLTWLPAFAGVTMNLSPRRRGGKCRGDFRDLTIAVLIRVSGAAVRDLTIAVLIRVPIRAEHLMHPRSLSANPVGERFFDSHKPLVADATNRTEQQFSRNYGQTTHANHAGYFHP